MESPGAEAAFERESTQEKGREVSINSPDCCCSRDTLPAGKSGSSDLPAGSDSTSSDENTDSVSKTEIQIAGTFKGSQSAKNSERIEIERRRRRVFLLWSARTLQA